MLQDIVYYKQRDIQLFFEQDPEWLGLVARHFHVHPCALRLENSIYIVMNHGWLLNMDFVG